MEKIKAWSDLINPEIITKYLIEYGTGILFAILIYLIGKRIARWITATIKKTMLKRGMDETLVKFIANVGYGLLLAFVIIAALSQLGVETTHIAAIFAAAGLAIGLALQGSLANFAAGLMIIGFRPFKAGDYIEAAGISGKVTEVGIFTTHLKTPDNKVVIVPNASVTSDAITNYSAESIRRIDLVFGIGYDDDIRQAKELLKEIIAADDRILKDPAPTIAVSELADSSVNFVVRPWVNTGDYWDVFYHLQETVKLRFDQAGISIPYPQQDLHLYRAVQEG